MKVLIPKVPTAANYPVQPAAYGYSNVGDSAEWSIATAYVVGNTVIVDALKSRFQCIVNDTGTAPTMTMTTPWIRIGSSNAWRPFDGSASVQVTSAYNVPLTYILQGLGRWKAICLWNVDASYVKVTHYRPDGPSTLTYGLLDTSTIIDAWTYCFGQAGMRRKYVIDGWDGYGTDAASRVEIEIGRNGGTDAIGVGEILIGDVFDLGSCHAEPRKRLVDYSKKDVNAYGDIVFVQRTYAYQAAYDVEINTTQRTFVEQLIEQLRATPAVYFPTIPYPVQEAVIYGFPSSFEITYSTPERSYATIEIEGIT